MRAASPDSEPLKRIFLVSPIGAEGSAENKAANVVRKYLVERAFEDFKVERADDGKNPGHITPQIIAGIQNADLVIIDLSGHNPNVFYEMAVAHGYGKPVVHIIKKGETLPFDVKDMRTVFYDTSDPEALERAQTQLHEYGIQAIAEPEKIETPLTAGGRFLAVEQSTDPVAESNVAVAEELANIKRGIAILMTKRGDDDVPFKADFEALQGFVERVVTAGKVDDDDVATLVTLKSTRDHDSWVGDLRAQLAALSGAATDPWDITTTRPDYEEPPF